MAEPLELAKQFIAECEAEESAVTPYGEDFLSLARFAVEQWERAERLAVKLTEADEILASIWKRDHTN